MNGSPKGQLWTQAAISALENQFVQQHIGWQLFTPPKILLPFIGPECRLYTVDPNQNPVEADYRWWHQPPLDFLVPLGHVVPTALAYHGNLYVGNLNTFPIVDGSSNIYKVNPSGKVQVRHEGLTAVLGLAFDDRSGLYVLEMTVGAEGPTPGQGQVLKISLSE